MRTSESIQKISAALTKALPEIQNATKDAENPAYRSTYATLNAVMDAVKPALFEHGIVVVQGPGWRDGMVTVTTRFLHESGEWIETEAAAPVAHRWEKVDGVVTDKGPDAQTAGSAISYLRRYSLAAMAGITQEDDDGNEASGKGRDATGKPRQSAPAKPTEEPCPKCQGAIYDNRAKKASGEFSAKSPDYACKDKDGCGWALWLDTARKQLKEAVERMEVDGTVPVGSTKRIMDGVETGDLASLRIAQDWVNSKATAGAGV
jgi:hypothetical protein